MTEGERQARRQVHVALAGIAVPYLAFVASIFVALVQWRTSRRTPAIRPWALRATALAIADVLVALVLFGAATGRINLGNADEVVHDRPRIGVALDPADPGGGAHVLGVTAGSPAERAGISSGDVIVAVDDERVERDAELTAAIGGGAEGAPRSLTVVREGAARKVSVAPELAKRSTEPLFRPLPEAGSTREAGIVVAMFLLECAVVAALCLRGRKRSPGALGVWGIFAAALGLSQIATFGGSLGLARLVGGASIGTALVGLVAGTLVLFVVAALGRAVLRRRGVLVDDAVLSSGVAPASVGRTVLGGLGYLVAGGARIAIVMAGIVALSSGKLESPGRELETLVANGMGAGGIALLAIAVTALAPLGEETLFRGVLLPWLRRWTSDRAALWTSAIVFALAHLHYGVFMVVVVLYGLVLGWARIRSGGLRAPMILHAIINSLVLVAVFARR